MRLKFLALLGILSTALQLVSPFIPEARAAPTTAKVYIDFGAGDGANDKYHNTHSSISDVEVNLPVPAGNSIVSKSVTINGNNLGDSGDLIGDKDIIKCRFKLIKLLLLQKP
ncbi:hypothetical protein OB236_09640 [Paenibacillus sp. WQ 127069]|uniref:IPT/TIG domain-containing protein n=1 Tax=Paenibacillus baimaensis TaxID=2982185 RepID=A0ABT2UCM8_9BACL|nr:hypothetical protein [Paenibacillus sp. WQ 127069]MCU6792390.1 hypothetical protein [Paenibacillus sp. WQ 127069]